MSFHASNHNHSGFDILEPLNCTMSTFHSFKARDQNGIHRFYNVTVDCFLVKKGSNERIGKKETEKNTIWCLQTQLVELL